MKGAFTCLLLPHLWASRNRAQRREPGDLTRAFLFGGVGIGVFCALFYGAAWLTWQLQDYEELGDYLLRLGLSWIFMTFLAFLTFSGIVTALSTFFLSDDLRLLLTAPIAARRLFYARFARTVVQSSWMVVVFIAPILLGVGLAQCAPASFYITSALTIVPFAIIPVAVGTACTLLLVNVFPARRARDLLMLMGFLFAASIVVLLRMIRPEQLLRAESLRDVSQWSQLLLLLALVLIYLYNFRVLDLGRVPYMSGFVKNVYAFVNLGMAGFVLATVAVRFVFPMVSAEGPAFWLIRKSPISMHDFLWSKFWTGFVPVLVLTETLTIAANELLDVDPFLKIVAAGAIVFLSLALVGLAAGLGARYPRFTADNPSQVAGSYGGVAFMIVAVLIIIVIIVLLGWPSTTYLFYQLRHRPIPTGRLLMMGVSFIAAVAVSLAVWLHGMRSGVRALDAMSN